MSTTKKSPEPTTTAATSTANTNTATTTATSSISRRACEERAKRIEQYYLRHNKNKKKTYYHFMDEGISKKTIYHVLRRHDTTGDVSFKKPTGRKVSVCTPEMFERLANIFKENPDLSCREAARQLGVARTTIFRIMAKMREKKIETYKVLESEPRCPTCHQKLDPTKVPKSRAKAKKNGDNKDDTEELLDEELGTDDDNIETEELELNYESNIDAEGQKVDSPNTEYVL